MSPGATLDLPWDPAYNALAYVLAGAGSAGVESRPIDTGQLAVFGPGDTITIRGRTAAKIDLKSRPDRGLLQTDSQARNQHGDIVFNIRGQILAERREPYKP